MNEISHRCDRSWENEGLEGGNKRIKQKIISSHYQPEVPAQADWRKIQDPCRFYELYIFCGNFYSGKVSVSVEITTFAGLEPSSREGLGSLLITRANSLENELNAKQEENNDTLVPVGLLCVYHFCLSPSIFQDISVSLPLSKFHESPYFDSQ